jgi:hypothetical protein
MDHNFAIKNNTAERYLLGELTEVEMEEYENHFFSCTICAEEVKLGSEFLQDARVAFKTSPQPDVNPVLKSTIWGRKFNWRSFLQPVPVFALALLIVGGLGIREKIVVQGLKEQYKELNERTTKPQVLASIPLMLRESRGVVQEPVKASSEQPFGIAFDIKPGERFGSYDLEVLDESGARKFLSHISAAQAQNTIQMNFPAGSLTTGNYSLVIRGVNSGTVESKAEKEIARYSFSVQIQ